MENPKNFHVMVLVVLQSMFMVTELQSNWQATVGILISEILLMILTINYLYETVSFVCRFATHMHEMIA